MTISKNAMCPCGSGEKYKRCCGVAAPINDIDLFSQAVFAYQRNNYQEAIKLGMDFLRSNKKHIETLELVSTCYYETGQLVNSKEFCNKLLKFSPSNCTAHNLLAVIYQEERHFEKSLYYYQKLLDANVYDAHILSNLGLIYTELGNFQKANDLLSMAIKTDPKYIGAYINTGYMKDQMGDTVSAVEAYKKALVLEPHNLKALNNLAHAIADTSKYDKALKYIETSLALAPNNASAISLKATIMNRNGDIQAAHDLLTPFIHQQPCDPQIALAYADICSNFGTCDESIDLLERILAKKEYLTNNITVSICFALGKLYDKKKGYEKAFRYYHLGNTSKYVYFKPVDFTNYIQRIISSFSPELLEKIPQSTINTRLPIFIVGMPRSGTSLVEQILSSHKEIYGAGELQYIPGITVKLPSIIGSDAGYPECIEDITVDNCNYLGNEYIEALEYSSKDTHFVTDKLPHNFLHLGLINILLPQAKIIHIKRNPLDTCISSYFQNFVSGHEYTYNLKHLAIYYSGYLELMNHWRNIVQIPMLEIAYEELIGSPEETIRTIIRYCDLEWDENCLSFYTNKRTVKTASYDQARKPIYTSSINRWEHYTKHLKPLISHLQSNPSWKQTH